MKAAQQVHPSQRQERQQLSGLSLRKSKDKSPLASQTSAEREFSQSPYMQQIIGYQQMANNSAQVKEAATLQAMADRSPQVQAGIQMQAAADAYVRANDPFNSTQSSTVQDSCSTRLTPTTESGALRGKNFAPADCVQCIQDTSSSTEERETRLSKLFARPQQQTAEKTENRTGLPNQLKAGVENLSGLSMDDVRVHYNSGKPAQLQAHAYTQGTDIHVAPGQKRHLPHEAWHVVQQKQGRVKPTMQMKGVGVNDDTGLEREADVMGGRALSFNITNDVNHSKDLKRFPGNAHHSSDAPVQGKFGFEIEVPIFFTKAVKGHPAMREDPGSGEHIDQGDFKIHVDHNEELRSLVSYANENQNGGQDGFAKGPPITEIVTKPWDEFTLSEDDVQNRAANIKSWVENVYAQASQGEAHLRDDYYVGSNSPKRTLQSTLGYFQTTFGVKLSKTPELFKKSGEAAKKNDSKKRIDFADQLIKAGKIGKSVVSSLKDYVIGSGRNKEKVQDQASKDELNMLEGYTTLLANYIFADTAIAKTPHLKKNAIGDYFYKTNLGSLSNELPSPIKNLLRNNDKVRIKYIELLSSKCGRDGSYNMTSIEMTINHWVTQVLNGGDDVFLNDLKNSYSSEIPSERVGRRGNQEAGVIIENREPQNLDPQTPQKRKDMKREKAALYQGRSPTQAELFDFLRDMTDPKKYPISQWESVMLRVYNLLKEING